MVFIIYIRNNWSLTPFILNIFRSTTFVYICIYFYIYIFSSDVYGSVVDNSPASAVIEFIKYEFNGGQNRTNFSKFTKDNQEGVYRFPTQSEGIVHWTVAEYNIIDLYDVHKIINRKNYVDVIMRFHKIAYVNAAKQKIIRGDEDIYVTYRVEKVNGRWWVVDPPAPNISLEELIKCYKEQVDTLIELKANIRPHQKEWYNKINGMLDKLISLKQKVSKDEK